MKHSLLTLNSLVLLFLLFTARTAFADKGPLTPVPEAIGLDGKPQAFGATLGEIEGKFSLLPSSTPITNAGVVITNSGSFFWLKIFPQQTTKAQPFIFRLTM